MTKIFNAETTVINDATRTIPVSSSPSYAEKIYIDGATVYICSAAIGSALGSAVWQVQRINTTTLQTEWADGDSLFDNAATNLTIVQGLSYS